MNLNARLPRWLTAIAMVVCGTAFAQTKEVTFAHQDMLVPLRTVMESGEIEKATGYKINWRMFGGGGDVIRAMASGDVQVGEVGSAGITAAASQGQDIKLFWILDDIADAEALVARNGSGINSVKDLKGKKVATPFVSTAHYQLMADMKSEGVDPKGVNVMNLRPPEIAAAWERGDIDAAFIWDPVLSKIKANGKTARDLGLDRQEGLSDLRRPRRQREVGRRERRLHGRAGEGAREGRRRLPRQRREVDRRLGRRSRRSPSGPRPRPGSVPAAMSLYRFPTLQEQMSPAWLGGGAAKAMTDTAAFLKEQGRVQEVKPNYKDFVTTTYVEKAMK